ncbi:hypothetical protein [Paenibacillus sp. PCH8]|uniref:hypothetical protein n=1 Tax=Paenibacillus sp. PCH8 TaxID=2066524 RepID=UPI0015E31481|nr:hypothetical protein [Paenibacillus sp. PCH8]
MDVDEWQAEYMLIAENTERRGEAELDPVRKGRQAAFLKDYWDIKNNNNNVVSAGQSGHQKSMRDVANSIGESERTTRRLIKYNGNKR